jgi:hypothetical protein
MPKLSVFGKAPGAQTQVTVFYYNIWLQIATGAMDHFFPEVYA